MPWETPGLSLPRRFFGTLRSTFSPLRTIQAVSTGPVASAFGFSLVWALPWMPLWAIMPFTHSLLFKHHFELEVVANKSTLSVPWDVARAAGIGVALSSIALLSWALPFASLLRAYAKTREPGVDPAHAAWRMVLYRVWVVPCGLSLLALWAWSLPPDPNPFLIELSLLVFHLLPRILILMHCFAMARYFGVEGLASFAVAVVPLVVEVAVGLLVGRGAQLLLPNVPGAAP